MAWIPRFNLLETKNKYLICILGPTAIGKTAVAIEIAKYFGTEIISADSRQFFKEISIGTAKPGSAELGAVPHHFIGHISIDQRYSAGDFERDALVKLDMLFKKHDLVVMVGGSGLYVKALLEGLDKMPGGNEELRKELDNLFDTEGLIALQNRLLKGHPDAASTIDMQNTQRVMRAIEIAEQGGMAPAAQKKERPFIPIRIILNTGREILYERINNRVDEMMKAGLENEAKRVWDKKDTYALQTVGYTELFDYFEGRLELNTAINLIKQHTRNYAKRQITWFKKEANAHWFEPQQVNEIITFVKTLVKQ